MSNTEFDKSKEKVKKKYEQSIKKIELSIKGSQEKAYKRLQKK